MDVSVIIVNYKTPDLVKACVDSICKHTMDLDYEIIVVDNGSNDGSYEQLQESLSDKVILIKSTDNLGFGKANNLGACSASGNWLFLLNSDTLLLNNAISILFHYIEDHHEVGIVGGNLYSADGKPSGSYCEIFDTVESVKKQSRWYEIIRSINNRRQIAKLPAGERIRRQYQEHFNFSDVPKDVAYIYGTDLMISRELFLQIDGFDPDFFMYGEETELSFRVHKKGYCIRSIPNARIMHLDGASVKREEEFNQKQYAMRSMGSMLYFEKCFGTNAAMEYQHCKRKELSRLLKIASAFRRKKLLTLTKQQMHAFDQVCQEYSHQKG